MLPKAKERRLAGVGKTLGSEVENDASDMTPAEEVLRAMKRRSLAELIGAAMAPAVDTRPLPGTADATDAMNGKLRTEATPRQGKPQADKPPTEAPHTPKTDKRPDQPSPWYEERSSWRKPGEPARYDESAYADDVGGPPYGKCLTDYDPLAEIDEYWED